MYVVLHKFDENFCFLYSIKAKGEHESWSLTSTCGFICGKPTGQVTHRSEFLGGTGLCRSGYHTLHSTLHMFLIFCISVLLNTWNLMVKYFVPQYIHTMECV